MDVETLIVREVAQWGMYRMDHSDSVDESE